jgi:hypothetical protein
MSEFQWRKPSRSGANGDNCVEVATNTAGVVAVRDSKDPHGPVLVVTTGSGGHSWPAYAANRSPVR